MEYVLKNAKALLGALITFLGSLQVGLDEGLNSQEVLGSIIAGLVALGAVYAVPNKGQESAQAVVDQVRVLVPEEAKQAINEVVPAARGVLKTVE